MENARGKRKKVSRFCNILQFVHKLAVLGGNANFLPFIIYIIEKALVARELFLIL
jgi:hypothetical protein